MCTIQVGGKELSTAEILAHRTDEDDGTTAPCGTQSGGCGIQVGLEPAEVLAHRTEEDDGSTAPCGTQTGGCGIQVGLEPAEVQTHRAQQDDAADGFCLVQVSWLTDGQVVEPGGNEQEQDAGPTAESG